MTKSAVSCGFGHIYWWKTSFFVLWSWFETTISLSVAATILSFGAPLINWVDKNGNNSLLLSMIRWNFVQLFDICSLLKTFLWTSAPRFISYIWLPFILKVTIPYYVNPLYVQCLTAYAWYEHFTCVLQKIFVIYWH